MLQINKHFYLKEHYMAIWDNLQCHNTRLPLGHTTILTKCMCMDAIQFIYWICKLVNVQSETSIKTQKSSKANLGLGSPLEQ